tara:strand:- start:6 stop:374 length:369 start_codon:yes stop_codon:yes gene_type:complete
MTLIPKKVILRSRNHQMFVAKQPCIICRTTYCVQCCHVRSIPNYGNVGKGSRNDAFTLPMCFHHHMEQHDTSEYNFYCKYNINPILVCKALAKISPCKKIKKLEEGYYDKHTEYFKDSTKGS